MTSQTSATTVTSPGDRGLHIERTLNAPRDRVWAAYTEPELLAQWWGRGNRLDIEKWELERGGHWRFVEHHEGGSSGFEGRFREVTPKDRIVWSFEWDGMPTHVSVETIDFVDLGDGRTKLVLDSIFLTAEDRDGMIESGMEQGLNESFAALDAMLARTA
ncbi:SRPBCC family protein [Rhodococcus sp. TAF43]|uniref:SRPBCC family protein n=1 Tax=unclassified Rhodococcus (in: high G+C Gram-positive bacteria) TaxID=192944 RepID=UPI001583509F|nr:SRPBCC family protein [Rhodococcus sp. W8901]QKT10697.1 SRPBCC family protein [Rhodococcus sp. W8901]